MQGPETPEASTRQKGHKKQLRVLFGVVQHDEFLTLL